MTLADGARMGKDTVLALAVLALANAMLGQDLAALNVALPSIERDLNVDLTTAQWVVNAYLLIYGVIIVTAARLADEVGRRRVFLVGAGVFAVTTLLAGFAPGIAWLIAARALMGIGAGLMLPAITGMSYAVVPRDKAARAGAIVIGGYGVGMALGPIIGGALTEFVGWRWIQFLNVPFAILLILGVRGLIPSEETASSRVKIDYRGIVVFSAGVAALLFALDQATDWGWGDWRILASLLLAALLMAAFPFLERRAGETALVPGDIIRNPGIAIACATRALMAPAYAAAVLYLPQIMQKLMNLSPLEAGVGMLPMLGAYAVVSFLVGAFAAKLDPRLGAIVGLAALAAGPFFMAQFDVAAGYTSLVLGMVLFGIGLGLYMPSITTEAVQADDRDRKSLAAGLTLMAQFVGGAIGLGITTTIVASSEQAAVNAHLAAAGADLTEADRGALQSVLTGAESAQQVVAQFDPAMAQELLDIAAEAFAAGVRSGLRLDAALAAVGFLAALLLLRVARRDQRTAVAAAPHGSR
jgi:EmrB/QacA subfamily drug resistance transporter